MRRFALPILALLALSTACNGATPGDPCSGPVPAMHGGACCEADADCGDGQRCGGNRCFYPGPWIELGHPTAVGPLSWELDLGETLVGRSVPHAVGIRNPGTEPLQLILPEAAPPFSMDVSGPAEVAPGGMLPVMVWFTPDHAGAAERLVRIETNVGAVQLRLRGQGVVPSIRCTPAIEFASAIIGTTVVREVECANETDLLLELEARLADGTAFGLLAGATTLGRDPIRYTIEFAPQTTEGAQDVLEIHGEGRGLAAIPISGRGSETALEIDGPVDGCIDFGTVPAGSAAEREIVVRNLLGELVTLTGVATSANTPGNFTVDRRAPIDIEYDDPATDAAENEVLIAARFAPTAEEPYSGILQLDSTSPGTDWSIQICLRGEGVAP